MAKYYAVKSGRKTGIFNTWDECKANVDGYSGAIYKSFKNFADAKAFLKINTDSLGKNPSHKEADSPSPHDAKVMGNHSSPVELSTTDNAIAYVDGSFNVTTGIFSYGVVMFFNGEEIHLSDCFSDPELASMRNVAGEIHGSMAAMKFAIEHKCKTLSIYHDYEGIAKWPLGLWKANKKGTLDYKKYYDRIKNNLTVTFIKVKGHSGDKYNDLADILAKKAAGI